MSTLAKTNRGADIENDKKFKSPKESPKFNEAKGTLTFSGHSDRLHNVAFSPDGRRIVSLFLRTVGELLVVATARSSKSGMLPAEKNCKPWLDTKVK